MKAVSEKSGAMMLEISETISIPLTEVRITFVRASGPGGQNVNKVATSVQLYFDVAKSPSLPDEIKTRLIKLAGTRMTADGILVIEARRYRTQERNKNDALHRFATLVNDAIPSPKHRRVTRPSDTSRAERLEAKRRRGEIKRLRRRSGEEA